MSGVLNHRQANIIRELLIAQSLGTDPDDGLDYPVFVGKEPNNPNELITVFNTTGVTQTKLQITGRVQEKLGIQVMVRSRRQAVGFIKAQTIMTTLDPLNQISITIGVDTYLVHELSRSAGVLDLGTEKPASNLNRFTINFLVVITKTS